MSFFSILVLCVFFFCQILPAQSSDQVDELFKKMDWRNVGPANMGGRTVDIDVVEKEPWIIYAAIGPSGVWKSINNGITWEPVFEKESSVSVGDIAIAQSHPDIVWVGSGEATSRNSTTIGDGVYKSENAGKTWTNMGLKDTRHISRIIINPGDPNIVYVAAMGHLWGANEERGIYKTSDGGKTWEKILYINRTTGFSDLVMDPSNSLTLFAAAYDHQRCPYFFRSGGPGSAIYKTTDGGRTWNKLTEDLPEGTLGRIGLDISRSNPNVVYALIEHQDGGIWRSEDKGKSWKRTCDKETYDRVNNRPFYYSQIRIDPSDDKVVYVFSGGSFVSMDMGQKFQPISAGTHPDHHALWIDPTNPLHLIDGNDGGVDITYDRGKTWFGVQNMTLAEVYQVGFDMRDPYYVFCGLQDNGSWAGPSATLDYRGITNSDWIAIGGGDGFYVQADPSDPDIVYSNWQVNNIYRYDMKTGLSQTVKPISSINEPPYRYNWNSPIHISPHDPKTVYTGGNFLFKTTDGGLNWEIISPDLTTDDPEKMIDSGGPITPDNTGAESHCTIITISESPVEKGVIWCGTDDGNLQVSKDGGGNWTNVVNNIKDLPVNTWCSRVEASHFDAGTAYAAFDGHRTDDYNTYVFKTTNFGRSWESIKGNLPFGWAHVIREDLKNKELLYVGLEFGVYASLDGGESWFSLQNNLPTVAVRDIAVHPRDNDLIIGTHGRGIWILDDITPLQNMTADVFAKDVVLFPIQPATQFFLSSRHEFYSKLSFVAQNPLYGLQIRAYFKEKPKTIPMIAIKNQDDNVIFEIRLKKKEGIQSIVWGLQYIPRTEDGEALKGSGGIGMVSPPFVSPGEYMVELKSGETLLSQKGIVLPDPRVEITEENRTDQVKNVVQSMMLNRKSGLSVTAVNSIRRQFDKIKSTLEKKESLPEETTGILDEFEQKIISLEKEIIPERMMYRVSWEKMLRGGTLNMRILSLGGNFGGFPHPATQSDLLQLKEFIVIVDAKVVRVNTFIAEDIVQINEVLKAHDLKIIRVKKVEI